MCCGQDDESDGDYESADKEEGEDGYICALTESQTAEDSDKSFEVNFEPPASADTPKPPRRLREAKIQDCQSRGNRKRSLHQCCAGGNAIRE